MKKLVIVLTTALVSIISFSQERVFTRNASISFFSKSSIENIEAYNKNGLAILDKTTGQVEFSVLMKGFEFEKALMQEHFNENYVESDKFPKAVFKGVIIDSTNVDFSINGDYRATVSGNLTIHGEIKEVSVPVVFIIADGCITATTEFIIALSDFKISVPSLMKDNIAKNIRITVVSRYQSVK